MGFDVRGRDVQKEDEIVQQKCVVLRYGNLEEVAVEIQHHEDIIHDELALVEEDMDALQHKCAQLRSEKEEVTQNIAHLQDAIKDVFTSLLEVALANDTPWQEQVENNTWAIQKFKEKISNLEACIVPSTPLEVRELRQKGIQDTVDRIRVLEVDCAQCYKQSEILWNQLEEDEALKIATSKVQVVQNQLENLRVTMLIMSIKETMVKMSDQKQLQAQVEQIQQEQ